MNISLNTDLSRHSPAPLFRDNPSSTVEYTNAAPSKGEQYNNPKIREAKRTGKIECQTCKERKYQDGSDDPGVSFKTAGHIDPGSSASVVMAHEREHVRNEQAKASGEGREIISQNVALHTSVCPECGRTYVSGGETTTVTKGNKDNNQKDFFLDMFKKTMDNHFGRSLDVRL